MDPNWTRLTNGNPRLKKNKRLSIVDKPPVPSINGQLKFGTTEDRAGLRVYLLAFKRFSSRPVPGAFLTKSSNELDAIFPSVNEPIISRRVHMPLDSKTHVYCMTSCFGFESNVWIKIAGQ